MKNIQYGTEFLDQLKDKVHEQQWEIERLNNIINKAIDYINDNIAVFAFGNKELPHWELDDYNIQDLLDILKGVDKE